MPYLMRRFLHTAVRVLRYMLTISVFPFFIIAQSLIVSSGELSIENINEPSFQEVKRIIDSRCVICHGCYDAPCQLKLTSYDGLMRGASSIPVYNPSRIKDGKPTRLFVDAHSLQQWQQLGFHSVIGTNIVDDEGGIKRTGKEVQFSYKTSVLSRLLNQKKQFKQNNGKPLAADFPLDITRELGCPSDENIATFIGENPKFGMPYGMASIPPKEQRLLEEWIEAGFPDFDISYNPSLNVTKQISEWEIFFNRRTPEQQLVSRYLYEHLFLGHLILTDDEQSYFFRLIRSTTSSGVDAKEIATTHPNGKPENKNFYYRLQPITATLVDKTHFTYFLDSKRMDRWEQLFFTEAWKATRIPEYTDAYTSNPFLTFQDIPVRARYQFLLDDAYYFINNFIKGPVCRGQVALNVINDYFFVSFLDPDYDLSVRDKSYLEGGLDYLALSKNSPQMKEFTVSWIERLTEHQKYLEYRDRQYSSHKLTKSGFPLDAIWQDPQNGNDKLTVFRHFDSATVQKGFIGNQPATSWVLDYPTFERIYYNLVVNYNVFGSVSHQVLTRLYMDYLRMESESLLLAFLPKENREEQFKKWYKGIFAQAKIFYLHSQLMFKNPTRVEFQSKNYFDEFVNKIRNRSKDELTASLSIPEEKNKILSSLNEKKARSSRWVGLMPEVVYILIYDQNEKLQRVSTLLRNKAHTNVSFILGEDFRRLPEEDTSIIIDGTIGSYPNLIFALTESNISEFEEQLQALNNDIDLQRLVSHFGIRRTNPKVWKILDDLQVYRRTHLQLEGVLDMSRYSNL